MNKKVIKTIIISLALIFIFNVSAVLAADDPFEKCDPDAGDICYQPEVKIPGLTYFKEGIKVDSSLLGNYISTLYQYLLYVAGVLAVIVIMVGGFQWITAGGNQSKIGEAKERVMSAIIGLFLALGSYLLLFTINPDLIKIHDLNMPNIEPITDYCVERQMVKRVDKPDMASIVGNEAECGKAHTYSIEGKEYQCEGLYCDSLSDEVCFDSNCVNKVTGCEDLCKDFFKDDNFNRILQFNSKLNENQECVFAKDVKGMDSYLCKYCSSSRLLNIQNLVVNANDCSKLKIIKLGHSDVGCWYKVCVESPLCKPDFEHRKCIAK